MAARKAAETRRAEPLSGPDPALRKTGSDAPAAPAAEPPPVAPNPEAPAAEPASSVQPPNKTALAQTADAKPAKAPEAAAPGPEVIVYYFHRTLRCHSCLQIEEWAKQAVENAFFNELAGGIIEWRKVNMELNENKHFVNEYELKNPALVLARNGTDASASWKDLEKVWEHLGDYASFSEYVTHETKEFLGQP